MPVAGWNRRLRLSKTHWTVSNGALYMRIAVFRCFEDFHVKLQVYILAVYHKSPCVDGAGEED